MNSRPNFFQTRKEKLLFLIPTASTGKLLELMHMYNLQIAQHSSRWFAASTNAYLCMLGLITLTKFGSRANKIMMLMAAMVLAFRQYEHLANKAALIQERDLIKNAIETRQLAREIQHALDTQALQASERQSCTIL